RHRVVMERVHGKHHRVGRRVVLSIVVILKRAALNRVAGIQKQKVRILLARLLDERGDFCYAAIVGLVRVVIYGKKMAVLVRSRKNRYLRARRVDSVTCRCRNNQSKHERQTRRQNKSERPFAFHLLYLLRRTILKTPERELSFLRGVNALTGFARRC